MNFHFLNNLLVFAALVVVACGGPAEYLSPLGAPAPAAVQERLVGIWANIDSEASIFLHINPTGQGDLAGQAVYTSTPGKREAEGSESEQPAVLFWRGTGYVTQLDDEHYAIFRRQDNVGDSYTAPDFEPGYSLFKIRFDGSDRFRLGFLMQEFLKDFEKVGQIKIQQLKGSNRFDNEISYLYVTVDTLGLQELIRTADETGWDDEELLFQRIVPASERN